MLVKLHANAATTPKTRTYIQASSASVAELARELGVSETTVRRWKGRREAADRSHAPHRLTTRFTAEEEEIAVELRTRNLTGHNTFAGTTKTLALSNRPPTSSGPGQ